MKKNLLTKMFHPPVYPSELPSKSGKVAYWYHWHIRLMDTGRGQVFGKVTQLFSEIALLLLVLDKVGYAQLSVHQIIIFCIVGGVLVWFSGWCFIMLRLDIVQNILSRYRDTMFKDMYDIIKRNGGKDRKTRHKD